MGETEISWTHRPGTIGRTWNPGQGCSRVSEGCRNCYAERLAARFADDGWSNGIINLKTRKWNGKVRLATHKLADPLKWRRPSTVFVNSMTDLFHEGYSNEEIAAVFGVMAACPRHTFQILTKRARRMREWFDWVHGDPLVRLSKALTDYGFDRATHLRQAYGPNDRGVGNPWPLLNVWLGVSVENQEAADDRIPELLRTPAAVRFLSCEPLIGPVALSLPKTWLVGATARKILRDHGARGPVPQHLAPPPSLDWVIAGCESGPGARPCDVEWLRSLRDQCAAAGVAFFLKQAVGSGEDSESNYEDDWELDHRLQGITRGAGSKRKAGSVIELPYLDGEQHAAFPEVA